jgi:ATP-dependent helicase/nuclease subunit A
LRLSLDLPLRATMTTDSPTAKLGLSDEQEQAVARRSGPLLLSAGAGSGKTSVLVERFVRAVREDGIAASRILAITFTERAAGELRARVASRLVALGERESAREGELAFVSTFHSFCARLLRSRALLAGLHPDFQILDDGLAGRLRERAFGAALREFLDGRDERVDLVAAYGPERLQRMIAAVHSELRSAGERAPGTPPVARGADDDPAVAAAGLLATLLALFGERYEALKRERAALDFDDLELGARDLLRDHEDVRTRWSQRFDLLMVDEFQDTNRRQLQILSALERDNLFTVGDELQAIYSFRHAELELFRARRRQLEPAGASLRLRRNYRSRPALLEAVNAAFQGRFGGHDAPLVPARRAAPALAEPSVELLLTARGGWERDEGLARGLASGLPAGPLWRHAEARALARRIGELVEAGRACAGEVAVLLRAVSDMEVFEGALAQRGLSTLATVGRFWERQQVADLLAYLRALANPLDEPALFGVLASPLVGISRDGLAQLAQAARAGGRSAWETLGDGRRELHARLGEAERETLSAFRERLAGERRATSRRTISTLLQRALDHSRYRERVLALPSGRRRLANVHKLLRLASRFEAAEGRDLRGFLDYVDSRDARADRSEPDAPLDEQEPDAVRLMSVHAAKGLEFAVVCVADLGREPNLRVPELLVEGEHVGLRLAPLDGSPARPALDYERLAERRRRSQAEEEDRILYVAMTRARERLLLSGAVDFTRWPEPRSGCPPIAWLAPALSAELPGRLQGGERAGWEQPLARGASALRVRLNAPHSQPRLPALAPPPARESPTDASRSDAAHVAPAHVAPAHVAPAHVAPAHVTPAQGAPPRAPGDVSATAAAAGVSIDALSYTTLNELERCGYRYYLQRVLGLPERPAVGAQVAPGLSARARGALAHRLLESVDFASPRPTSERDVARAARTLGMRVQAGERGEVATLVNALLTGADGSQVVAGSGTPGGPGARVAGAARVRREHPFTFSLGPGQPLLGGVMDLLAHERDGGVIVLDYKTDRVGGEEDLAALVAREYETQRLLYALAVLRAGAPRVEIVHWFLHRPGDWVSATYDQAQRAELEERVRARIARALRFDVSARPRRALCETCPGRGTLCSHPEAVTLAA